MAVIKHTSKPSWWYITVSQGRKGKQLYIPFQGTRGEAQLQDQLINSQIKNERITTYPTILQTLPTYTDYYRTIAAPKVVEGMLSIMRRCLLPHFGMLQAHQIVPALVYAYTSDRLSSKAQGSTRAKTGTVATNRNRNVSHRTVQKELNHLKAMTRWMHLNGMAEKIPTIPTPPKAKTRPKNIMQPLTLDELTALLNQIPADKKTIVLLMSDAGLRMAEALNLQISDTDLPGHRLTVKGKGGKVVVYPILTKRLYEALTQSVKASTTEWISINPKTDAPYQSIKKLLELASKRAKITKHVTHHVLRHTFSNLLMESGISTEARKQLMRHSTLAATEHYTHTSPQWMENQAESYQNLINGSLSLYGENFDGAGI